MKARLISIAGVFAVALSACGSVTGDINFQAPGAGWTASPPILGRTQIWVKNSTGNKTHNSVLILAKGVGSSSDLFNNPGITSGGRLHVDKDDHVTICGNQAAEHITGSGTYTTSGTAGKSDVRAAMDAYVTTVHGERYLAMYMHPAAEPPDPQAETAIASLCAKPE